MKKCSYCLLLKDISVFPPSKQYLSGISGTCRECINAYKRAWRRRKKGKPENWIRKGRKLGQKNGFINKYGYRILARKGHPNAFNKQGGVPEHTVVMTEHLGRALRKGESVHHKNGIRDDNRIENLELWVRNQTPGQRLEDKIKWCIEFLKSYGYIVNKDLN